MALSNFNEVKAYFVACHQHPINQALHHLTNALAFVAIALLFYDWRLTLACILLTQVLAWGGHFLFEKNKPAAFKNPGITNILASISWSFDHWFGLRQILVYLRRRSKTTVE